MNINPVDIIPSQLKIMSSLTNAVQEIEKMNAQIYNTLVYMHNVQQVQDFHNWLKQQQSFDYLRQFYCLGESIPLNQAIKYRMHLNEYLEEPEVVVPVL